MADDWAKYLPPEPTAPSEDVDWMKYIPEQTSGWASALRGAAQELTFGYADELAGGLESAFTDKTYRQARDESREAYRQAEADNPAAYTAGQVAGGLASLAVPVGAVGRAASTGAKLARAAGAGAAYGAGKSEAEDLGGLATDAATGAALAGGVYGAGKLALEGGGRLGRAVAPLAETRVGQLAKNVIANKAKASVAGALAGALGGDPLAGAMVGLGVNAVAPAIAKGARRLWGGRAAAKAAAEATGPAESVGVRWAKDARAFERPVLGPPTPRSSMPRPALVEPPPPAVTTEPPVRPAPPHPTLGRDPKSGRWISLKEAKKRGIEPEQAGAAKERAQIPAEGPGDIAPPTSQEEFLRKVQADYVQAFKRQGGPTVLPDEAPTPGPGRDMPDTTLARQLREAIRQIRANAYPIPAEDRGALEALTNIVSTQSRAGKIPGLKHYPVPPDAAFKEYLAELPKSTGGSAAERRKALSVLITGMRHGREPGELIYRARAAGVPDEAIMRAVGVKPVQRTAKEAAAAAELVGDKASP